MQESYDIEIEDKLRKKLEKLHSKDTQYYNAIIDKILQISKDPSIGKPLCGILKGKRRVHVGPFVLIYEVNDNSHVVTLLEFAHHDDAYKR